MTRNIDVSLVVLSVWITIAISPNASARNGQKYVSACRIDVPLVVDGVLDETCWAEASIATDFINYKTETLAFEQTLVRVLYDDTNLYVGFECLESDRPGLGQREGEPSSGIRDLPQQHL